MRRPKFISWHVRPVFVIGLVLISPLALMGLISMPKPDVGILVTSGDGQPQLSISALMDQVLKLNRQNKHQQAIQLLTAALANEPSNSLLRTLLVQTFDLFLDDEIRAGQKDVIKNPQDIQAYVRVSSALELLGDSFRAMEFLLQGIANNTKNSTLWMAIGRLELKSNRNLEALDVFREVIRLDNTKGDAFNNAAHILANQANLTTRDLIQAEKFALSARKLDPKNPEYLDTLAQVHFKQGKPRLAQSLIKEAILIAPEQEFFKNQLKKFEQGTSLIAE